MNNNLGQLIIGSIPVGDERINYEMEKAIVESDYILCENINSFLSVIYNDNNIKTNAQIMVYSHLSVDQAMNHIKNGKTILLTTECGYPSIADPGSAYISACNFNGINVSIIAGASIPSMAFVASGLQSNKRGFIYQPLFDLDIDEKHNILSSILATGYPMVILDYNDSYYDVLRYIKFIPDKIYTISICIDLATKKSLIYNYDLDKALDYFKKPLSGMHTLVIKEEE